MDSILDLNTNMNMTLVNKIYLSGLITAITFILGPWLFSLVIFHTGSLISFVVFVGMCIMIANYMAKNNI